MERHPRADLVAVTVCSAAAALTVWLVPDLTIVRIALALALVLVLPGYALTAAVFPSRSLGLTERLLLMVALSLIAAILGSLVLDGVGIALDARSWVTLLASVTIAAAVAAMFRAGGIEPRSRTISWIRPSMVQIAALTVAALVLVGAIALARTPLRAKHVAGYTAFWLVRSGGDLALGVRSGEQNAATYRVEVRFRDHGTKQWSFRLTPGTTWRLRLRPPGQGLVVANLYRGSSPLVYRRTVLHPA
jgi:uncharacterized membrane protein